MKTIKISLVSLLAALFIVSCGPSVEQLGKQWDSNKAEVSKLQGEYPNLKDYLAEDLTKGSAIFDKVASAKDEDGQSKLLQQANDKINNGIAGKIKDIISAKKAKEESLTSLKAKAPSIQVEEANKDFSSALTQTYSSYDEASTSLAGAKNNYKTSKTSLDNLIATVTKFEATKKDVAAIESKIDALLSEEEYTVRILKMVTDAKDALRDAKPAYEQSFAGYYDADQSIALQEATITERLAPLKKIVAEKEAANKPAETTTPATTTDSKTNSTPAAKTQTANIVCKYCKTSNLASATKCSKCKAPLKK